MSARARRFSLLDLLVTLGFTLGATAACLGVLAAVSHTGKRDGALVELENDAEIVYERLKRDVRAARATPQSRLAATANFLSLDVAYDGNTESGATRNLPPSVVTAIERKGETTVLHLDFGPASEARSTRPQRVSGFLVDSERKIPITLTVEGNRATGQVPPGAAAGAWLTTFRLIHWRLAAAADVTRPCTKKTTCALYRLVDASPPSGQPVDLNAHGAARASSKILWKKVADGVSRFDAEIVEGGGAVDVTLAMKRQGRSQRAYTFETRRSFALRGAAR